MTKEEAIAGIGDELDRMSWGDAFGSAVKNIPSSAGQFAKDIAQPFIHPIDTVKAVGGVALGAAEKLIPGEQEGEQNFDAVIDFMKDRYGSIDNFKKTIAKDPVGVLGDIATLATGTGAGLKAAGTVSKIGALKKAGSIAAKAGMIVDPLNAVQKGLSAATSALPERLYQSAAKFTKTATRPGVGETSGDVRKTITQAALEKRIMPTYKGLEKLDEIKKSLGENIESLLSEADAAGFEVARGRLFKDFTALRKTALETSTTPKADIRAINKIQKDILDANKAIGREKLNASELQAYKTTIYDDIENYYKKTAKSPITVKVRKTIARNAKKALEEAIPEIKRLNKEYGVMKRLSKAIEDSAGRITNRDLMGIGIPLKAGAGGAVGGKAGGVLGLMWGIFDAPTVKASTAIAINELRKKGIKITPTKTAIEMGLFQSGRDNKTPASDSFMGNQQPPPETKEEDPLGLFK